jgi:hypothetical protein
MSAPPIVDTPPRRGRSAIIVAGALGIVVAALAVLFVHVHGVSRDHANAGSGYDLTSAQQAAVTAASTEAINVLSYNRKTFAADFARALNGATGQLASDLKTKETTTKTALVDGKFDLSAKAARPGAYAGVDGKDLLVLVTVNGFKTADDASASSSNVQRLQMTMQLVKGKWLAASLNSVGVE